MDMAWYIGHRGDYHEAFLQAVRDASIPLNVGVEVVAFDEDKPSITFADGREEEADIIIGADGIKSRARELVLGFTDVPKKARVTLCYRAYFPESTCERMSCAVGLWIMTVSISGLFFATLPQGSRANIS